jgi:outer membrane biosynthesis protein TonB
VLGLPGDKKEVIRKLKSKIAPTYPDLARRMNLGGVVKVKVTVATHRYVSGNEETTGIVEFRFDATQ